MNFLKEPLLHFLVAGSVLFAAYGWLNRDADDMAGGTSRVFALDAGKWQGPAEGSRL